MDSETKARYEGESLALRAELKTWESAWAKDHSGKKPSREDIKQNPDIAQKYKQYNKLRDILSGKVPPEAAQSQQRDRKRKSTDAVPPQTPSKRTKVLSTPRKSASEIIPADLPGPAAEITTPSISRTLFSPALPTSIGPTPQKEGRVLGLFDLLGHTPSRTANDVSAVPPIAATPSRRRGSTLNTSKTPTTSGRYADLNGLTTPLHERNGSANAAGTKTPSSSVRKLQFSTPAFLRRTAAPLPPVDENGEWNVAPLRLPKKPLVRSLSNMMAGLRKIEDEALDDEEEAMREMEMEAEGIPVGKNKPLPPMPADGEKGGDVEVGDSQLLDQAEHEAQMRKEKPVLLGGFDDENAYDSSDAEQLDRGQPLRVYKKKGQKRTTRRSNLKPMRARRPAAPAAEADEDDELVPETQFDATKAADENLDGEDLVEGLSGSDFEGELSDSDDETKAKAKAKKASAKDKGKAATGKEEKEGTVKKAVRMVKASAHANFKRLKLKNKGTKGGPGYNSRFRRKR
ncbi:putative dna replication regulator sld2 protein [Podospora aff. communis PSN243]|uniref:DNA replication regulator SLD2 n=1 Tax=Podospora aff. communis PSN243 TaxID=3040156 RepID=A0AAV9GHP3_9PEZI|nr:putative dna replication regulator sld2 protein [Podospora aff. communis PSN243]